MQEGIDNQIVCCLELGREGVHAIGDLQVVCCLGLGREGVHALVVVCCLGLGPEGVHVGVDHQVVV